MFAPRSDLRDPCPDANACDLTTLDWTQSWDYDLTQAIEDGYGAAAGFDDAGFNLDAGFDLDAELRDLLTAEVRAEANGDRPVTQWTDEAIVAEAARLERLTRWAAARGYELVNELARRRPDPSGSPDELGLSAYAVDEIAVSTGITRWAACRRVAEADALTHRHPQLLRALSAGCVSVPAVLRVLETTAVLDTEDCATLERRLLDRAGRPVLGDLGTADPATLAGLSVEQVVAVSAKATPGYLARVARDLAHRLDPDAASKRERAAKTGRSVRLQTGTDGMAWLTAHLPAAAAAACYEHLDQLAHALPAEVNGHINGNEVPDGRSMDAKRADVLVDLLLGAALRPDGTIQTPAPINIHVIVDGRQASVGHGHSDRSGDCDPGKGLTGEIAGLGPVTSDTLRDLLDLTDHTAGTIDGAVANEQPCPGSDVHQAEGPGPYAPPERLKNLLRVRHRSCVFPGCARPSRTCELDHTVRHPEGPTCTCNLAPLCTHHHHLKHHAPGWHLVNHRNGTLTWTTPTGRRIEVGEGPEPPGPPQPDPPPRPEDIPPF